MNENKFVKFIIISIILLILSITVGIAFLFVTASDEISNTANSIKSAFSSESEVEPKSTNPSNSEVSSVISNTVANEYFLDVLFDELGEMSEEQYDKNVEILLGCGVDNIKSINSVETTDEYTIYTVFEETKKYLVVDIFVSKSNDIIKVMYHNSTVYENGEYFYVMSDFVLPSNTINLYKDAVILVTKRNYKSNDVSFYSEEVSPYYVVEDVENKKTTVYGYVNIKDEKGNYFVKEFEAKFTDATMDTINYFEYVPE